MISIYIEFVMPFSGGYHIQKDQEDVNSIVNQKVNVFITVMQTKLLMVQGATQNLVMFV